MSNRDSKLPGEPFAPVASAASVARLPKTSGAEHVLYGAAAPALLAMIAIGFAPTYFLAGGFLAPLPSALIRVHAITLRRVHRASRFGLVLIALLIAGTLFVPSLDPWKQFAAAVKAGSSL